MPLGDEAEAYEVDVMDGAAVKRTLIASAETVLYMAAQQTTDFGSPQGSVEVNVYQSSATVGCGSVLNPTL